VTPIVRLTLLFSACFLCFLSAAMYALVSGFLSPRGFGVAGTLLCVGGVVVLWIALSTHSSKAAAEDVVGTSDETIRKRQIRTIRFYQGWIALLVFCLIFGLSKAGTVPIAPLAVGVVMNLLMIFGCVQSIKRLRRGRSRIVTSDNC
jgi:hypothetical protein